MSASTSTRARLPPDPSVYVAPFTPLFPSTPPPTCHPPEPRVAGGRGSGSGSSPRRVVRVEFGPKRRATVDERGMGSDSGEARTDTEPHAAADVADDERSDSRHSPQPQPQPPPPAPHTANSRVTGRHADTRTSSSRSSRLGGNDSSDPASSRDCGRDSDRDGKPSERNDNDDTRSASAAVTAARGSEGSSSDRDARARGARRSTSSARAAADDDSRDAPDEQPWRDDQAERASSVASAPLPLPLPPPRRPHTATRRQQCDPPPPPLSPQWEAQAPPPQPHPQPQPLAPSHATEADEDGRAAEVDALSGQLEQDMQLLSQLKSERDGMASQFHSLMQQIHAQQRQRPNDDHEAGPSSDAAAALDLQQQFDEQLIVYETRIAQLEEAITGAATRMAIEHQQQQQQQQPERVRPQQSQQHSQYQLRHHHQPSSTPRPQRQHQHQHVSFAQDTPPSAARPSRRAAFTSQQSQPSSPHQPQHPQQPHDFSAAPAALELPELPRLSFPPAASLLSAARTFEQRLSPALHEQWAEAQRAILGWVARRDGEVARDVAGREGRFREEVAAQYEALVDRAELARQAAALHAQRAATLAQQAHALQAELQHARAQLSESEGHRRDIAALYEQASLHIHSRAHAEPALQLAETRAAAADLAAESGFLRTQLGLAHAQIEQMHAELQRSRAWVGEAAPTTELVHMHAAACATVAAAVPAAVDAPHSHQPHQHLQAAPLGAAETVPAGANASTAGMGMGSAEPSHEQQPQSEPQSQPQQHPQHMQQAQPSQPQTNSHASSASAVHPSDCDARVSELESQLSRLHEEMVASLAARNDLQKRADAAGRDAERWRAEAERAAAEKDSLQRRLDAHMDECSEQRIAVAAAASEAASALRLQLEQSEAKWDAERTLLQGRVQAESQAAGALVARIADATQAAQRAEASLESERSARVFAVDDAADRDSLVRAQHERLRQLQAQLHAMETRSRDAADQHAAQLAEVNAALAAATAASSSTAAELRQSQSALTAAQESLQSRDEQLRASRAKLSATRAARRTFEEQIARMEVQLRAAQAEVARLAFARVDDARTAHARLDALERALAAQQGSAMGTARARDGSMIESSPAALPTTSVRTPAAALSASSASALPSGGTGATSSSALRMPASGYSPSAALQPSRAVTAGAFQAEKGAQPSSAPRADIDADLLQQLNELKQLRHALATDAFAPI